MKSYIFRIILLAAFSFNAFADKPGIMNLEFIGGKLPDQSFRSKRIAILFENSKTLTETLNAKFKSLGYEVAGDGKTPDETITIDGFYVVEGRGSKEHRGDAGKLAEVAFKPPSSDLNVANYANGTLVNVGLGSLSIGKLSPEELIKWIGAETGIAAYFNSLFSSKKAMTRVYLRLSAPSLYWSVDGRIEGDDTDLADLFAQTLISVLNPLTRNVEQ